MKLFEPKELKFEQTDRAINPEFGLMDTILDHHRRLLNYVAGDITAGNKRSDYGRQDVPSVEQIVWAAIYKELKQLDYRELEYHQGDSRICVRFV